MLTQQLLAFMIWLSAGVHAGTPLQGEVVEVPDGDTLTILDSRRMPHRIRIAHIDAPEIDQRFGTQAQLELAALCLGAQARLRIDRADRHRGIMGTVSCNGIPTSDVLVRLGLAWVSPRYTPADSTLFALQQQARDEQRGLWTDPSPVSPWIWRRNVEHEFRKTSLP